MSRPTANVTTPCLFALYQPTEFSMIPILAAASAISTIDKVASGVLSQWKHLTSPGQATGKPAASSSFAALLAEQGGEK
jgi:hypothetical protein